MIKLYVRTNLAGSEIEDLQDVPEDWDSMSLEEQDFYLNELADMHMQNNAEFGAYVIELEKN
jgi:hypothetical protein